MIHERTGRITRLLLVAGSVAYAFLAALILADNEQFDGFVYRAGVQLALDGKTPYDTHAIQAEAARTYPPKDDNSHSLNCGFFLSPQAIAIFAPFAMMKWAFAKTVWFCLLTLGGIGCGALAWTFCRNPACAGSGSAFIVLAVLLNPITLLALLVGQTGLLIAGCIAVGQYCFEKRRTCLGCLLWAIPFFKPHLAILFLALAAVLGGWRRVAGIVFFVALLNLLGGLLARGTVAGAASLFREYVEYLGSAHGTVKYNLIEQNYQILSWNRMIVALGGPAFELKMGLTLLGFATWSVLIVLRTRLWQLPKANVDPAYFLAATAVGALFCAQVLAYESILLVLLAPLILQHIDAHRRYDAAILIGLVLFLMIPINLIDAFANLLQFDSESFGLALLRSHNCFGMGAWLFICFYAARRNGRFLRVKSNRDR